MALELMLKGRATAGPSTAMRSGRDDKGEGLRFQEPFFITLGEPKPMIPLSKTNTNLETLSGWPRSRF
jgi:hypothetical protein